MKALNNPGSAEFDPLLIKTFPDQNNPTSLNPQYLAWINQFGSAVDLRQQISNHIQSRFPNIKLSLPF